MGSNSITRDKRTPSKIEGQSRGKVLQTPPKCSSRISGAWLSHVCKRGKLEESGAIWGQLADGAIQYPAVLYFDKSNQGANQGQLADGVCKYSNTIRYRISVLGQCGAMRERSEGKLADCK